MVGAEKAVFLRRCCNCSATSGVIGGYGVITRIIFIITRHSNPEMTKWIICMILSENWDHRKQQHNILVVPKILSKPCTSILPAFLPSQQYGFHHFLHNTTYHNRQLYDKQCHETCTQTHTNCSSERRVFSQSGLLAIKLMHIHKQFQQQQLCRMMSTEVFQHSCDTNKRRG